MGHTLARKTVYRLVGSAVVAVLFLVGMAAPVSALTIQATQGATATIKVGVLSSQRTATPGASAQQQLSGCDECGYMGQTNGDVPRDPNAYQRSLGVQSDPSRLEGFLQHADYVNRTWLKHYHAGTLQPWEKPVLVPRLSNRQKAILQNESRYLNRLGLGLGVAGGAAAFASPPVGFGIGTLGAGACSHALRIDECLQNAGTYEAP